MSVDVREICLEDCDPLLALWSESLEGDVSEDEARKTLSAFLHQHLGFSLVATEDSRIVGAILCGVREGTGVVHRLLIGEGQDRDTLGKLLIDKALGKLIARGVHKCHIDLSEDESARSFWDTVSWNRKLESAARSAEAA